MLGKDTITIRELLGERIYSVLTVLKDGLMTKKMATSRKGTEEAAESSHSERMRSRERKTN